MTNEVQANLLPCPFCGGEARSHKTDIRPGYQTSSVRCKKCHAEIGRCDLDAEGFWNRRQHTDWQPIDSIPKDGSLFDLWVVSEFTDGQESCGRRVPDVSYWDGQLIKGVPDEYNEKAIEEFSNGREFATHWMPLPTKPE